MRKLFVLAVVVVLVVVGVGRAHPVPKTNHDRTLVIRLFPEGVVVDYRLELDEYQATVDMRDADLKGVQSRKDFHAAFTRYFAEVLANNLDATLDGKELEFTCISQRFELLDHVRCDYRFRAPWKLPAGKAHRFTFHERNYHMDDFSLLDVSLDASLELTLRDVSAPTAELIRRPADKRKPGDDKRLRTVSATVLAVPSLLPGVARSALPPDPTPGRNGAPRRLRGIVGRGKPVPSYPVARVRTTPPEESGAGQPDETQNPSDEGRSHLLRLLFDTRQGLAVLLLLAAGFGAAHALTPGHGKTLVAAYLIGQRGTVGHALVLGLATTLSHTGTVILLAVVLAVAFPGANPTTVQAAIVLVGGLLISGLGLWLLLQRLTGRADHVHLVGGHHHGSEPGDQAAVTATWWQVIVLGIGGGIVPCWDAILLLLLAISTQQLWLAVPLLLAFSAGLAGVLVLLGIFVVYAGEAAQNRFGDGERFQQVIRALPILSAAVITVLGLVLTFSAAHAVK